MHLLNVTFRNVRLHRERQFHFSPQINVIYGANAAGKTTLLEGIFLLLAGRSFRTNQLADLTHYQESGFSISASFIKQEVEQSLLFIARDKERKILHNRTPLTTLSSLIGLLQGVAMTPNDIALIKEGPQHRRRFMDLQLSQANPTYLQSLLRYHRAMRQRNQLLRQRILTSIESWEEQMAQAALYISHQRHQLIIELSDLIAKVHPLLCSEESPLSLRYRSQLLLSHLEQNTQHYLEHLRHLRSRELMMGTTLFGPHRDDFSITIGEKEARHFASEGQQRTAVCLLRLAEWERLFQQCGERPLLLVDDIGGSLDSTRRQKLMEQLHERGQVLFTSTEKVDFGACTHFMRITEP